MGIEIGDFEIICHLCISRFSFTQGCFGVLSFTKNYRRILVFFLPPGFLAEINRRSRIKMGHKESGIWCKSQPVDRVGCLSSVYFPFMKNEVFGSRSQLLVGGGRFSRKQNILELTLHFDLTETVSCQEEHIL